MVKKSSLITFLLKSLLALKDIASEAIKFEISFLRKLLLSITNEEVKKLLPILQIVDIWSYRIIGLGFPFLTLGIISGAVWANEAWGSYWSWDPKETWALITWLVFAVYLHSRLLKGWQGQKAAFFKHFLMQKHNF